MAVYTGTEFHLVRLPGMHHHGPRDHGRPQAYRGQCSTLITGKLEKLGTDKPGNLGSQKQFHGDNFHEIFITKYLFVFVKKIQVKRRKSSLLQMT